jgi:hypothetical protein
MKELLEAVRIVDTINEELFELAPDQELYLNINYCFGRTMVEFFGMRLWDSDNDDREYLGEDIEKYENLENYKRKEFNKISTKLPILKEL